MAMKKPLKVLPRKVRRDANGNVIFGSSRLKPAEVKARQQPRKILRPPRE